MCGYKHKEAPKPEERADAARQLAGQTDTAGSQEMRRMQARIAHQFGRAGTAEPLEKPIGVIECPGGSDTARLGIFAVQRYGQHGKTGPRHTSPAGIRPDPWCGA